MKLSKEQLKDLIKEVSSEQVATGAHRAGGIIELANSFRKFVAAAMITGSLSKKALTKLIFEKLVKMSLGGPFALLIATYEISSLAAWIADRFQAEDWGIPGFRSGGGVPSDRLLNKPGHWTNLEGGGPIGAPMTMDQRTAMFRKDAGVSHRVDHLPIQESTHWLNNNYGGELVKITKSQLKRIIKEELESILNEGGPYSHDPDYHSIDDRTRLSTPPFESEIEVDSAKYYREKALRPPVTTANDVRAAFSSIVSSSGGRHGQVCKRLAREALEVFEKYLKNRYPEE